jgi:hypothetical protein
MTKREQIKFILKLSDAECEKLDDKKIDELTEKIREMRNLVKNLDQKYKCTRKKLEVLEIEWKILKEIVSAV